MFKGCVRWSFLPTCFILRCKSSCCALVEAVPGLLFFYSLCLIVLRCLTMMQQYVVGSRIKIICFLFYLIFLNLVVL